MKEKSKLLVSIVILTYKHEDYIKQALDSVLMQEVNFNYEILVGDDFSPDNTRKILKQYDNKFPEKFIMVYHDKNIGAHDNVQNLYKLCKGKYIAFLEGDDYWTSKNKLQLQVDYLELHKEYIATAHKVKVVDRHGNENKVSYPECKEEIYTLKHYRKGILPGQSATIVSRNIYNDNFYNTNIFKDASLVPGDRVKVFVLVSYGDIYCFPEIMSAYRFITDTGTSYSALESKSTALNQAYAINYYHKIMNYAKESDFNNESIKTIEYLFFRNIMSAFFKKNINYSFFKKSFKEIKYRNRVILFTFLHFLSSPIRTLSSEKRGEI